MGQICPTKKKALTFPCKCLNFLGVPKGMDRYVPNIEDIILFAETIFVNIRKNICKHSMLQKMPLDGIG